MSLIQRLHDFEIGGEIEWRADGLIEVNLGHWKPNVSDIGTVANGAAAMRWLQDAVMRQDGLTRVEVGTTSSADVMLLDKLRTSGRHGHLYWMYDSTFHAELGDDPPHSEHSWKALRAWLTDAATASGGYSESGPLRTNVRTEETGDLRTLFPSTLYLRISADGFSAGPSNYPPNSWSRRSSALKIAAARQAWVVLDIICRNTLQHEVFANRH
jgi:hypothetical protein